MLHWLLIVDHITLKIIMLKLASVVGFALAYMRKLCVPSQVSWDDDLCILQPTKI